MRPRVLTPLDRVPSGRGREADELLNGNGLIARDGFLSPLIPLPKGTRSRRRKIRIMRGASRGGHVMFGLSRSNGLLSYPLDFVAR